MARKASCLSEGSSGAGTIVVSGNARLFVGTGTFMLGFDELVAAADAAAGAMSLKGLAQIGHSRIKPKHLCYERFLPIEDMRRAMIEADLIVCHGGVGILGEAMRARKSIIAVARRGPTTRDHPAGDQLTFLERLARTAPIRVCSSPLDLAQHIRELLPTLHAIDYELSTDVPAIISDFLASGRPS